MPLKCTCTYWFTGQICSIIISSSISISSPFASSCGGVRRHLDLFAPLTWAWVNIPNGNGMIILLAAGLLVSDKGGRGGRWHVPFIAQDDDEVYDGDGEILDTQKQHAWVISIVIIAATIKSQQRRLQKWVKSDKTLKKIHSKLPCTAVMIVSMLLGILGCWKWRGHFFPLPQLNVHSEPRGDEEATLTIDDDDASYCVHLRLFRYSVYLIDHSSVRCRPQTRVYYIGYFESCGLP